MGNNMKNFLLESFDLPPFSNVTAEQIVPAIDTILANNRQQIKTLLGNNNPSWENLLQPLTELNDRLSRVWSMVSHMNAVVNSKDLRKAYNECLPKLSQYSIELGQNEDLYHAVKAIADSKQFAKLDIAQQKVISNQLRDFKLSGVNLNATDKQQFLEISKELSLLQSKFEENILDATNAWHKNITDKTELSGLPEYALEAAKQTAQEKQLAGWVLTLQYPCYFAVITYADNAELRKEIYTAYTTRASDQGPHAKTWDNSDLMQQIIALRHKKANLIGYDNYAQLSLATKMAKNIPQVLNFLNDLAKRCKQMAQQELQELQLFAKEQLGIKQLQAWDLAYVSEKLKQHKYQINEELLRPYFAEPHVIQGMFNIVERLFGITIKEQENIDSWHKDVRFFNIYNPTHTLIGQFYMDNYARPHKRGGAWMDECRVRYRLINGTIQTPIAYLTCNFDKPVGEGPSLLTHDYVTTLFHEFGHTLHHLLTTVDYAEVSGINGVAWDAVELPSQLMEHWCWEKEALDLIAKHYKTGQSLPKELFASMKAAQNFQTSMQTLRQLEFAIFDFRLHAEYNPQHPTNIQDLLNEVREQTAVVKPPAFNRFQHAFSHIFAGGYAAGYYSYKWAEVLACDAYSLFEETGIFNSETGLSLLQNILQQGGSKDAEELFIAFRGREPNIEALLKHNGIT